MHRWELAIHGWRITIRHVRKSLLRTCQVRHLHRRLFLLLQGLIGIACTMVLDFFNFGINVVVCFHRLILAGECDWCQMRVLEKRVPLVLFCIFQVWDFSIW